MYGSSQFDGSAAAFMGGGFMPTQTAHPPSDSSSISKNREARCLFPLTVKQISNLASNDESNFTIDGAEVNNVTVVGRVSHKEDKASEYTFLVDDGTGQIECTKWVQESLDTEQMGEILVGMYVRVHGHLRGLQGRRFLNVFSIRPVTDFNEIPGHFIECIYVHFYKTRLQGVTSQPPVANSTSIPLKGYQTAPPYQSSVYSSADGLNNVSQMILNFLQQPAYLNTEGAHYDVIARQLNIPMNKLKSLSPAPPRMCKLSERNLLTPPSLLFDREELQMLVDNGLVYTTINDDYYKSTVNA